MILENVLSYFTRSYILDQYVFWELSFSLVSCKLLIVSITSVKLLSENYQMTPIVKQMHQK